MKLHRRFRLLLIGVGFTFITGVVTLIRTQVVAQIETDQVDHGFLPSVPSTQSAQQIIDRAIIALGGRKALSSASGQMYYEGEVEFVPTKAKASTRIYTQDKSRLQISEGVTTCFKENDDGMIDGWKTVFGIPLPLSKDERENYKKSLDGDEVLLGSG